MLCERTSGVFAAGKLLLWFCRIKSLKLLPPETSRAGRPVSGQAIGFEGK
jgi:hypothetical protein